MEPANPVEPSWYEAVEGPDLEQGDILPRCPITTIEGDFPLDEATTIAWTPAVAVNIFDVIVLSQSCDVAVQRDGRRRVDHVVVSPVWELPTLGNVHPEAGRRDFVGNVIRGRVPTWHALAPSTLPGLERPHLFVELRRILTVPAGHAEALAARRSPRLRLRSPWRERLSAAVGDLFSRPAIPYPIPPPP